MYDKMEYNPPPPGKRIRGTQMSDGADNFYQFQHFIPEDVESPAFTPDMVSDLLEFPGDRPQSAPGRPTLWNPIRIAEFLSDLVRGNTLKTSAYSNGFTEDTISDWRQHKPGFSELIKIAQRKGEKRRVNQLDRLGNGGFLKKRKITTYKDGTQVVEEEITLPDRQALMWVTERRNRQEWGEARRYENLSDAELKKALLEEGIFEDDEEGAEGE